MIGPESLANNIPVLEHGNIRKKKFTIVPYEQFTQHIEPTLEKISTPERASDIIDAILGISDVNSAQ